jgi:hypothetical protein
MGSASGNPDNLVGWSIGRRKWTAKQIVAIVPDLGQVLPSLLGKLREGGLVQENDTAPDAFKQLSAIPGGEPSWSPTQLGEKILGFYAEAGAEGIQDPGGNPGQNPGAISMQ